MVKTLAATVSRLVGIINTGGDEDGISDINIYLRDVTEFTNDEEYVQPTTASMYSTLVSRYYRAPRTANQDIQGCRAGVHTPPTAEIPWCSKCGKTV